jgi:acyl-CoA synthetase (AMP-forming)/AMP-acid ligase II
MSYNAGILNLLLVPLAAGASVYISQSFSSVQLLRFIEAVEKKNITVLWVNPTILRTLYKFFEKHPGIKRIKEDLDGVFTGMAPLAKDEKTKFESWLGLQIYENYALTETQFLTSTYACERTSETVGKVLPWVELIVDGDDNILVKAETLFEGYMQQGKVLRVPGLKNDYFATGDLGRIAAEHELKLTGRAKESIKRGGYLVEFTELEQLAMLSTFVEEALAIPVADALYGENTVVCLVLRDESKAEPAVADVAKQYTAKLAPYKFPKEIAVMKAFPKSSSGKTIRRQVQQIYLQNQVVHAASF